MPLLSRFLWLLELLEELPALAEFWTHPMGIAAATGSAVYLYLALGYHSCPPGIASTAAMAVYVIATLRERS